MKKLISISEEKKKVLLDKKNLEKYAKSGYSRLMETIFGKFIESLKLIKKSFISNIKIDKIDILKNIKHFKSNFIKELSTKNKELNNFLKITEEKMKDFKKKRTKYFKFFEEYPLKNTRMLQSFLWQKEKGKIIRLRSHLKKRMAIFQISLHL